MKSAQYFEKVRHLDWLNDIRKQYEGYMEYIANNQKSFTVTGIGYECRGDGRVMKFNSHRPVPTMYIYEGLVQALREVKEEIAKLENELKTVVVEL